MAPHMTELITATTTTALPPTSSIITSALEARLACRSRVYTAPTSGLAPTYIQANLIVLPSAYAADFRLLCQRNPVPCPLLAESSAPGAFDSLTSYIAGVSGDEIAKGLDLRSDVARFNVYRDGLLVKDGVGDVKEEWADDHVAFLIGCSFSFESALVARGLVPRHMEMGRNVCMYRTSIPLCPAGVFCGGTYVVSMRPYKKEEVEEVRSVTRAYTATHGEPVGWGWEDVQRLGIKDMDVPEWGDKPLTRDGRGLGEVKGDDENVPVFWGCGVTPQEAVMRAGLKGTVMAHTPGYMLVVDVRDWDIVTGGKSSSNVD